MSADRYTDLSVSSKEKVIAASDAVITGVGGAGVVSTALWLATTPIASAGLGISLGFAASVIALSVVGVLFLSIAVPIAILTYRNQMNNAQKLHAELCNEVARQRRKQRKLFFSLLKLRCFYANDADFMRDLQRKNNSAVVWAELIKQVNFTYHYNCKQDAENLAHDWHDFDLDAKLQHCFCPIPEVSKSSYGKAAAYGIAAGISIAGISLGTGWTFAALLMGAGLMAAVPFAGWIAFGVCCIAIGVIFGLGIALCKQKNMARDKIKQSARESINVLSSERKQIDVINTANLNNLHKEYENIKKPAINNKMAVKEHSKLFADKPAKKVRFLDQENKLIPAENKNKPAFSIHRISHQLSSTVKRSDDKMKSDISRGAYGIH